MKCPSCNLELGENAKFCPVCGTKAAAAQPAATYDRPVYPQSAPAKPAQPAPKLMSPWAYVGWQLLFSIPLVGFILLVVFSFDNNNLNLRNFARSYWCAMLIGFIILILAGVLMVVAGVSFAAVTESFQNMPV